MTNIERLMREYIDTWGDRPVDESILRTSIERFQTARTFDDYRTLIGQFLRGKLYLPSQYGLFRLGWKNGHLNGDHNATHLKQMNDSGLATFNSQEGLIKGLYRAREFIQGFCSIDLARYLQNQLNRNDGYVVSFVDVFHVKCTSTRRYIDSPGSNMHLYIKTLDIVTNYQDELDRSIVTGGVSAHELTCLRQWAPRVIRDMKMGNIVELHCVDTIWGRNTLFKDVASMVQNYNP